ncbi:hypothetical protein Adt_48299 [Abeliophyllum distichum]|uniref:Transcriptional coactivator Hfi1/Transcriptional adapter 1 n=1 Tax=Abeliophyllum distichum TaxID=126358 RepID=A0ABD1NRG6_9LAMI
MLPPKQHSRINLAELKSQIVLKLGLKGSKRYFYYLNRFLSLKLSKVEFNKACLRIVGRENIPLHNQFIRSILKNACSAKVPPLASQEEDVPKHGIQVGDKEISTHSYQLNGSHTSMIQASGSPGLSNGGGVLSVSPRKARTGFRDRRTGERRSVLGANGKTSFAYQQLTVPQSTDFNGISENGDSKAPDATRPVQYSQGLAQQAENESEFLVPRPAELLVLKKSSDGAVPVHSKDETELLVRDEENEVSARFPLEPPLGVPLCPVSTGVAHRALLPSSSSRILGTFCNGALLDDLTLRERMEHIALAEGLERVTVDCANLLNHGLDSYMKGLIRSCIELVGARSGHELEKKNTGKHQAYMKRINGVRPGYQYQTQSGGRPLEADEHRIHCPISLQDFRFAMELNPRHLGEDWPLLLEKICIHTFER